MIWAVIVTSIAALLVAAKSHGRQLRLEREFAGYDRVTFGGANPPFVESLWRNDRVRYWRTFPVLLTFFLSYLVLSRFFGLSLPFPDETRVSQLLTWVTLSFCWSFVWSFTLIGLTSFVRLRKLIRQSLVQSVEPTAQRRGADWENAAIRGSVGWWLAVLGLAILTVLLVGQGSSPLQRSSLSLAFRTDFSLT